MGLLKNSVALLFSIMLVSIAAGLGAGFGPGEWYASLNKPAWNPPNWLFGPVWTTLYLLMAVSSWLVWRHRGAQAVYGALALYGTQLLLNAIWTPLFFGAKMMGLAFVEILILEGFILATIAAFYRVRPLYGLLLIPYACWVGFASFLNFTLWRLNS
jgi:benzodiazapine receptor